MNDEKFYDIVDSEGNVVETAEEQRKQVESEEVPEILEPKPPTEGELKKLRKLYVTTLLPRVIQCGHRLDLSRQPRQRNCEACWFAWFNNHGEIVQQLDEMYTAGKADEIIILQGIKFYKRWRQFMSTVAQWQKVAELNETTNSDNSPTEVVG